MFSIEFNIDGIMPFERTVLYFMLESMVKLNKKPYSLSFYETDTLFCHILLDKNLITAKALKLNYQCSYN